MQAWIFDVNEYHDGETWKADKKTSVVMGDMENICVNIKRVLLISLKPKYTGYSLKNCDSFFKIRFINYVLFSID